MLLQVFVLFSICSKSQCISEAWMCCSKVTSITVEKTEAGLTNYQYSQPCVRYWVTPAGYIGSCVIGAGLIVSGEDFIGQIIFGTDLQKAASMIGALISSGILAVILGITIFFQKNWIPRILTVVVIIVVVVLFLLVFVGPDSDALGIRLVVLFVGIMNGQAKAL